MLDLSNVAENDKVADLGTGDGRIAIAFAKKGALVDGFELDEKLVSKSQKNVIKEKVEEKVTILKENFWDVDLSSYDIITIYPMPDIMLNLEEKLEKELKRGARVLLNYYPFLNWKYITLKDNIYFYVK